MRVGTTLQCITSFHLNALYAFTVRSRPAYETGASPWRAVGWVITQTIAPSETGHAHGANNALRPTPMVPTGAPARTGPASLRQRGVAPRRRAAEGAAPPVPWAAPIEKAAPRCARRARPLRRARLPRCVHHGCCGGCARSRPRCRRASPPARL